MGKSMDPVRAPVEQCPDFFANRPAWLSEARRITDFGHMCVGLSNACTLAIEAGRIIINTGMGFAVPTHKNVFGPLFPHFDALEQRLA